MVKISKDVLDERLKNLSKEYKSFEDKKNDTKSEWVIKLFLIIKRLLIIKEFEGGKGEGVAIELGKDLFLQGFDKQLIGLKKNEK